jgi:hypothetical protein
MSLWRVDDKHTSELMAAFYKNLNNGENITEAIHASKIEFIENTDEYIAHPSNWAAFVPVGENPVIIKKGYGIYILLLSITSIIGIFLYLKFRNR